MGLPQPPIDLGPDGGAAVITPTSPDVTVQTGNKRAASLIQTGDVPQTVLVTITKLVPRPPWLDTQLDQYGPGYEFTVTPVVTFDEDILAGACINSTGDFALDNRLRLAHNNPSGLLGTGNVRFGNIEIISETAGELGPLGLSARRPSACSSGCSCLIASMPPGSPPTTGGKVRNYSPFAAVDPLLTVSANSATSQSGAAGAAVGAPPSVKVQTRLGTLINSLVTVDFVPTAGSGSVTGGTQTTSGGIATVGSWTINAGPNTLNATASGSGVSFIGSPVVFTADGALPAARLRCDRLQLLRHQPTSRARRWAGRASSFPRRLVDRWGAPFGTLDLLCRGAVQPAAGRDAVGIGDSELRAGPQGLLRAGGNHHGDDQCAGGQRRAGVHERHQRERMGSWPTRAAPTSIPSHPSWRSVAPGTVNKLAVIAKDRGSQSYLDLKVTARAARPSSVGFAANRQNAGQVTDLSGALLFSGLYRGVAAIGPEPLRPPGAAAAWFDTARKIVSSPAMVPTISGHASRSSAMPTRFASPGGVCTTTSASPAGSAVEHTLGDAQLVRITRAGAAADARRYTPSTFTSRSAAMSRLTEDCVTCHPSAASASASSSCVRTARVLMSSRILRWRFRRSAVIGAGVPRAGASHHRSGGARARHHAARSRHAARARPSSEVAQAAGAAARPR